MNRKFDFDDINLIPKKCIVDSRSQCNTDVVLGKHTFKMPVIPANMSSVIDVNIAEKLAQDGFFYIMHRFLTDKEVHNFVKTMNEKKLITSISIGVKDKDYELLSSLFNIGYNIDYITIDIAHGHAESVKNMINYLKESWPSTFIIAGNIATTEAAIDLIFWGANAIKVGVGPGKVCTTYYMSGFGSRNCQASTIYDISKISSIPIIADGGIEYPADIAKSLVLGATMVMCGNLLSGCSDSPGELKWIGEEAFKEYWGSASDKQEGKTNRIEGTSKLIPYKNKTLLQQLIFLQECLQSSISYGGGKKLSDLNIVRWN